MKGDDDCFGRAQKAQGQGRAFNPPADNQDAPVDCLPPGPGDGASGGQLTVNPAVQGAGEPVQQHDLAPMRMPRQHGQRCESRQVDRVRVVRQQQARRVRFLGVKLRVPV